MQRLVLDFLRTRPATPIAAWGLLVAGLAMAGWAASRHATLSAEFEQEKAAAAKLLAKVGQQPTRKPAATSTPEKDLLDVPWGDLFARLEATRPGNIAFLAIDADGRKRNLTLAAEARNAADMIAYLEALRGQGDFGSVVLSGHSVMQADDGSESVRFFVRLGWGV